MRFLAVITPFATSHCSSFPVPLTEWGTVYVNGKYAISATLRIASLDRRAAEHDLAIPQKFVSHQCGSGIRILDPIFGFEGALPRGKPFTVIRGGQVASPMGNRRHFAIYGIIQCIRPRSSHPGQLDVYGDVRGLRLVHSHPRISDAIS